MGCVVSGEFVYEKADGTRHYGGSQPTELIAPLTAHTPYIIGPATFEHRVGGPDLLARARHLQKL